MGGPRRRGCSAGRHSLGIRRGRRGGGGCHRELGLGRLGREGFLFVGHCGFGGGWSTFLGEGPGTVSEGIRRDYEECKFENRVEK